MSILPRSLIRKIIHLCLACILIFLVSSPSINSQAQVVQPPDGTPEEIFQLTPVANQSEIPDPYISPSAVPAGLTGVWFGWITVDPAFGNKTFSTLIALQDVNIGELAGLIMHPSNRCGGETRLVSTGKDIVTMATDYTFGACIDGRHRLELNSDGTMLYEWHDPNSERVDRGTLNRTGGFGAGVPATHLGTWSGTITVDPDYGNVTFPVELAIPGGMMSGIIGTIMISTSKCGGEITANALNGSTMVTLPPKTGPGNKW